MPSAVGDVLSVLVPSLVVAAAGTWLLARLAPRLGAVAKVKPDRWHATGDVPRLAGPAMLAAAAPWLPLGPLAVLAAVCALGSLDDMRPLSPRLKALGLLAAGLAGAWVSGEWWVCPALWLVANAVNLLDHADGIAAAAAAAAFIGLGGDAGWAAAGACAGFLLFNYPPARVFMGDSASLTLGAMAVLIGAGGDGGGLATLAWCAVPLADAVAVTLRRLWRGQKPWIGGVDHSGHALLRAGIPRRLLPPLYFGAVVAVGELASAWS